MRISNRYHKRHTFSISIGAPLDTLTVSPKYQVVIPKRIRERLALTPGQKLQAIAYDDRIELIPVVSADQLRGFVRGIDTGIEREGDRA